MRGWFFAADSSSFFFFGFVRPHAPQSTMHTSLRLPRPSARRPLRTVAAVPDYGAAKANNLASFRGVQPPKSEAHPAPNAHPAW